MFLNNIVFFFIVYSNLNGKYYQDPKHKLGIVWYGFHGYEYSLKFVQMSTRPKKDMNIK